MHIRLSPRKNRRELSHQTAARLLILVFSILIVAQLAFLIRLPYTTSLFEHLGNDEVIVSRAKPPQNGFSIGRIHWDIRAYAVDPKLQPFRVYFNDHCPGRTGVAAALCLSDKFVEQFPFGAPRVDFFSADYDPVSDFVAHTEKGEPGHCVTRSGLAVDVLLSVGIPARVVQLIPPTGVGHSIFSVWDQGYGWVAIDPTFGEVIGDKDGPSSAFDAFRSPDGVRKYQLGQESPGARKITGNYPQDPSSLFRGHIIYPEPWLYLRTGTRVTPWPFRASFVELGPRQWWMGPAQNVLRYGIAICSALLIASVVVVKTGRRRLKLPIGWQPRTTN